MFININFIISAKNYFQGYLRLYYETMKSIFGMSDFTLAGLMYMLVKKHNAMIPKKKSAEYYRKNKALKKKFNVRHLK